MSANAQINTLHDIYTISVPAGNGQAGRAPDSIETIRVRVPIVAIFTRYNTINQHFLSLTINFV